MYENIKTVESGGISSVATGFLKGAAIAAIFTLAVFVVFALLLSYTPLAEEVIPFIALITEGLGAAISGFVPARKTGRHGALSGAVCGILYILIIGICASVTSDGIFLDPHIFIMAGISVLMGAIGGISGVNLKKDNKKKR